MATTEIVRQDIFMAPVVTVEDALRAYQAKKDLIEKKLHLIDLNEQKKAAGEIVAGIKRDKEALEQQEKFFLWLKNNLSLT